MAGSALLSVVVLASGESSIICAGQVFLVQLARPITVSSSPSHPDRELNAKIPPGTSVQVRITETLSSESASVGQVCHGSLAVPVVANGRTLFPKGA